MADQKIVWWSWRTLLKRHFALAMAADTNGAIFHDEFFKLIKDRHEKLEARNLKLMLFNNALTASLFLAILHRTVEFSAAGISSKELYEIKEIVLFIAATVGFVSAANAIYTAELDVLQKVYLEKKFGAENLTFWQRCVPSWFPTPMAPNSWESEHLLQHRATRFLHLCLAILLMVVTIGFLLVSIAVHIFMIIETLKNPSLPPEFFYIAMTYIIGCDFTAIWWMTMYAVPLPHLDFRPTFEFLKSRGIDPASVKKK